MTAPPNKQDYEWTDDDPASGPSQVTPPPSTRPLVQVTTLDERRHQHKASMQKLVLAGVGLVLLVSLALIIVAVWSHGASESFALEMGRLILPSVLGSGATIVGALFISGGRSDP